MAGPPPLMRPTFDVPIPTSKAPPHRTPTSAGNLRRAKTLTRPERGVAPTPLINPPSSIPAPAGVLPHSIAAYNARAASGASSWDAWSIFAHIVTFWAPPFLLSSLGGLKDKPTRQAWREKIALCFIALVLGAAVGFGTMGLNQVLCPENASATESRFLSVNTSNAAGFVSVGGAMFNLSQYKPPDDNNFFTIANKTPGADVSGFFTQTLAQFTDCNGLPYHAASDPPCSKNTKCVYPAISDKSFLAKIGLVATDKLAGYDWDYVSAQPGYIVLDGAVLDFTVYLKDNPKAYANDAVDRAIRTVFSQNTSGGKDSTRLFYNREALKAAIPCLKQRYTIGNIDKITPGCFISTLFLYVSMTVIMAIVLVRFAMACIFNWFMSSRLVATPKDLNRKVISPSVMPEGANMAVDNKTGQAPWAGRLKKGRESVPPPKSSKSLRSAASSTLVPSVSSHSPAPLMTMATIGAELFCVCLVTCYSEGEESIRGTCDSIAQTNYSDSRKLIFIVADGMITGAGEKRSTPDICVGLLEADPRFGNPAPMSYIAVGSGAKKENRAMVYAGHYVTNGHRTPTVIVVKCGTEAEAAKDKKPGNRGKRDSQLILMNFFSRVTYNDRMSPLDFDMFRKVHTLMGVTPDFFEVCLMVDADTRVYPDSVTQLVNCMHHDNLIMGVCGETRIANKRQSWVTAIQVYEYFISHHLAKAFESVFGGVTCLPGCFSMYRLKARKANDSDWIPLLIKPEIVREYSQSEVTTLHQKNLLLLGEDRFLTTILLRTFPNRKMMFCPQARCRTVAPDTFSVLLSQRRRWINSTIHNLMELVRVRNLCGTFCFSMQFVVFMDLLGTTVLPVAISLTYALVVNMALKPPKTFDEAIPLMLLVAVIGLPAILILITTRKVVYVFWMLIYLLALPVWNFILPVYAYWHFDDFSWGETRRVEGEAKGESHDTKAGPYEAGTSVPLRRWEDWERSRLRKLKREERRRRELERTYPGGGYGLGRDLHPPSEYWDGSDTVSLAPSEDDQWGTQIGAYNENGPQYPPPPTTLLLPEDQVLAGAATLGKEELEAMLESGFDDRPTQDFAPPSPRYQNSYYSDSARSSLQQLQRHNHNEIMTPPPVRRFDAYAPQSRTPSPGGYPGSAHHLMSPVSPTMPTNGTSSSVGADWKTHAKRRSGGRGDGGSDGWGPLGPLDPSNGPGTPRRY